MRSRPRGSSRIWYPHPPEEKRAVSRGRKRGGKIRIVILLVVLASLLVGLAGCQDVTAPHQSTTDSTERTEGIDEGRFGDAWGRLTDIIVLTAVASTLSDTRTKVDHLRAELDAIDETDLTDEEKQFLAKFYEVYWAYEDSLALWAAADAQGTEFEGIPLYRDGRPLVERANEIVDLYDLPLQTSKVSDSVQYVPDDSIQTLWRFARAQTQEWLVPVMEG